MFRDARSRLARIILQLGEEFGRKTAARLLIDISLTHAELATLAGTAWPTISITLGELEDEGLITRSEGKIVVLDRSALQYEAERTG